MSIEDQQDGGICDAVPHGWRRVTLQLIAGGLILLAVIWFARDGKDEIEALESWVSSHRVMGPIIFVCAVVFLTSIFVPSSLLSVVAGALFGLGWGSLAMIAGSIIGAVLDYLIANKILSRRIADIVKHHPKLSSIQRAVDGGGWRIQFILRLAPLSAVTVNYSLGAAGVKFRSYLIATLGLIPGLFVEVYFGHVAKHVANTSAGVSEHSNTHLALTIAGFLVCVVLMVAIGRIAQRAIANAPSPAE
tara:strand:- start:1329 stop:2069 length:741 start_codon:yes stop_codon:yes gene_type:complete